ncbi:histidine kinase [Corynebacterium lubricantis]|uniref:histidine kinase n=1 Tax=Corynebacterium lubricantis TaxID=541095 RepID=UPI00036C0F67
MNWQSLRHYIHFRDVSLAVVFVAVSLLGARMSGPVGVDLLLLAGVAVAPLTRRRWPLPTTVVALILLAISAILPELSIAIVILAGFTAYVIRRHLPPRIRTAASVFLLVGTLVALSLVAPALMALPVTERMPNVAWGVTLLIACGLLGELRRRSIETAESELQRKLDRQRAKFEQEALAQRTHIAREIHDIVTHSLTVIVAQADGGVYSVAPNLDSQLREKDDALKTISTVGRESLQQMRGVVGLLRDSEERTTSPQVRHSDISDLVEQNRAAGLEVNVTVNGEPPQQVPSATSLTTYRIVQEALTNARKHGNGTAEVVISWASDQVVIRVSNAVRTNETFVNQRGHGLDGIQERSALLGGTLTAGASGDSWVVQAVLPLPEKTPEGGKR